MSDRTETTVQNLLYECIRARQEQLTFYRRIHQMNSILVTTADLDVIEKSIVRLRSLTFKKP